MANPIGKWRRRALETRRSPYQPGMMICTACSAKRKASGLAGVVPVKKCRVLQDGLLRPGVTCPQCGLAWFEQEDQPDKVASA